MSQYKMFEILAEGLHACGISKNCALCIGLLLETQEQAQEMVDWILDLEELPTEAECLEQAVTIKYSTSSVQTP
jgi:hypothetical protein